MDNRYIVENTEQAITERFGSIESCLQLDDIHAFCASILATKKTIKQLKAQKQECASQFKKIDKKNDPDSFTAAKKEMQEIAIKLKQTEEQRKILEQQLSVIFEKQEIIKPDFPERFNTKTAKDTKPSSALTFSLAGPNDKKAWDDFVNAQSSANSTHLFGWKDVFESTFGHACWLFMAKTESQIVGVFPVCFMQSKLFGTFTTSQPFLNYGGPLSLSTHIDTALINYAWEQATEKNSSHLEIRTCTPNLGYPSTSKKVSMILSMPSNDDELDEALGAKVRAQYKQTEQHNPEFRAGGKELLDDFYAVFARNMRDLGTPVYPKSFFANILSEFSQTAFLAVVKINNKPVACAFLFGFKDMLEIPWASTIKSANKFNVNMWMYRQILTQCIQRKYHYFDFGRSTKDAGTFKFKKQWGAKPVEHYWYYLLPEGEKLPEINPDNPKYKLAISIWKNIPIWITKIIGPPIVKNIP